MDDSATGTDATTQTDVETDSRPRSELNDSNSRSQNDVSELWYKADKYKRYWLHHDKIADWFQHVTHCRKADQYREYYKSMSQYHMTMGRWMNKMASYYTNWYNTWLQHQNHSTHPHNTTNTWPKAMPSRGPHVPSHTNRATGKKRKGGKVRSKSKRQKQRSGRSSPLPRLVCVGSHDEQFEMEITDGMLDFFVQSAKHRKERDAKKREQEKKKLPGDDHIDLADANTGKNKATVLPPSERPGAKRTVEMKQLYGKGAAMIHGMETAMQLNYNRNCDLQQPKMWPQLPISIKFS